VEGVILFEGILSTLNLRIKIESLELGSAGFELISSMKWDSSSYKVREISKLGETLIASKEGGCSIFISVFSYYISCMVIDDKFMGIFRIFVTELLHNVYICY